MDRCEEDDTASLMREMKCDMPGAGQIGLRATSVIGRIWNILEIRILLNKLLRCNGGYDTVSVMFDIRCDDIFSGALSGSC